MKLLFIIHLLVLNLVLCIDSSTYFLPKNALLDTIAIHLKSDHTRLDLIQTQLPSPHHKHSITFAIQPNNINVLVEQLHQVSSLESYRFGQHLSLQQARQITRNKEGVRSVRSYLERWGVEIKEISRNDEYIVAEAEIRTWEKMLNTQFHHYESRNLLQSHSSVSLVRASDYILPMELEGMVQGVWNLVDFPSASWLQSASRALSKAKATKQPVSNQVSSHVGDGRRRNLASSSHNDDAMTISRLRDIYGIVGNSERVNSLASQALVTFHEACSNSEEDGRWVQSIRSDVKQFATEFGVELGPLLMKDSLARSSVDQKDCSASAETMLSLEYMMGVGGEGASTTLYQFSSTAQISGDQIENPWVRMLREFANMEEVPMVINFLDHENEADVPQSVIEAFNIEAMKLSLAGVTLITSSGEEGSQLCGAGNGAQFPATSPYVLVVGSTMVSDNVERID